MAMGRVSRSAGRSLRATSSIRFRLSPRLLPRGHPAPSRRRHPPRRRRRGRHEWMSIAQAFAGGVGQGRRPGQFASRRQSQIGDQLEDLGGGVAERLAELGQPSGDTRRGTRRAGPRRRPSSCSRTGWRAPRARRACAARCDRRGRRHPRRGRAASASNSNSAVGRCGGQAVLAEEVRVARRDDAVARQQAGVAVVGMQPVALPRIVAEHDLGAQLADDARRPRRGTTRSLSSSPSTLSEEDDHAGVGAAQSARRLALLVLALGGERGDVGVGHPTCPSIRRCRSR